MIIVGFYNRQKYNFLFKQNRMIEQYVLSLLVLASLPRFKLRDVLITNNSATCTIDAILGISQQYPFIRFVNSRKTRYNPKYYTICDNNMP